MKIKIRNIAFDYLNKLRSIRNQKYENSGVDKDIILPHVTKSELESYKAKWSVISSNAKIEEKSLAIFKDRGFDLINYCISAFYFPYIINALNPIEQKKALANKVYYQTLFKGFNQPVCLAYRAGDAYFDGMGGGKKC